MENINNNTTVNGILSRMTDNITISRAEYAMLLRDKTQLDIILQMKLEKRYGTDELLDAVLKQRGMMA